MVNGNGQEDIKLTIDGKEISNICEIAKQYVSSIKETVDFIINDGVLSYNKLEEVNENCLNVMIDINGVLNSYKNTNPSSFTPYAAELLDSLKEQFMKSSEMYCIITEYLRDCDEYAPPSDNIRDYIIEEKVNSIVTDYWTYIPEPLVVKHQFTGNGVYHRFEFPKMGIGIELICYENTEEGTTAIELNGTGMIKVKRPFDYIDLKAMANFDKVTKLWMVEIYVRVTTWTIACFKIPIQLMWPRFIYSVEYINDTKYGENDIQNASNAWEAKNTLIPVTCA